MTMAFKYGDWQVNPTEAAWMQWFVMIKAFLFRIIRNAHICFKTKGAVSGKVFIKRIALC